MEAPPSQPIDRRWQRIQAISGLTFVLFVIVHLANTLIAPGGADAYDGVQRTLRAVYQSPPVIEILLLGVVLPLHITAAVARARLRRRLGRDTANRVTRMHRRAGWLLVVVIYWHVAAVRLPAVLFDAPPGFSGVSFSIQWMPAWFYPYYFALALAGFYHAMVGSTLAARRLGFGVWSLAPRAAALATVLAAVVFAGALLAFGGVLFDVSDPFASDYVRIYLDFMNQDPP